MPKVQLNFRVDAALAKRLRKAAEARHIFPGVLVAQAIEALLSGTSKPAAQALDPATPDLAAALAALEQRVALLEQASPPAAPPPPAPPASPVRGIVAAQLGEAPAGAITTAEMETAPSSS